MPTVLFDIDGTLIASGGAGSRAMGRTARQLTGAESIPGIPVHGRTDFAIFSDLLKALEIEFEPAYPLWRKHYHHWLEQELFVDGTMRAALLPGAEPLLNDLRSTDWFAALITGNSEHAARLKLRAVNIESQFVAGGFGDWTGCRNEVARESVAACKTAIPAFCVTDSIMIGDTVHDVECAKSVNMAVIGVTTGGSNRSELQKAGANLVVDSLNELDIATMEGLLARNQGFGNAR
jgi:phosphoglycolate phosphatase-like HAD superfamily hydrolase